MLTKLLFYGFLLNGYLTSTKHITILQVLFRMKEYATEYKDDIIEEGAAIQQDMVLSQDRNFIFVMTSNKVCTRGITFQI